MICCKFWHRKISQFIDVVAYDGAALLVHLLPTNHITTFDRYASSVFMLHIARQLEKCTRVDMILGHIHQ